MIKYEDDQDIALGTTYLYMQNEIGDGRGLNLEEYVVGAGKGHGTANGQGDYFVAGYGKGSGSGNGKYSNNI